MHDDGTAEDAVVELAMGCTQLTARSWGLVSAPRPIYATARTARKLSRSCHEVVTPYLMD
jgi:hypothetical protein